MIESSCRAAARLGCQGRLPRCRWPWRPFNDNLGPLTSVLLALVGMWSWAGCGRATRQPPVPLVSGEATTQSEMGRGLFDNAIGILRSLDEYDTQDALMQAVERLNQWIVATPPLDDWSIDPLVDSLPPHLRRLPQVEDLGELKFAGEDGLQLQETVWLRQVAERAVGDEFRPLPRAERLFDWTIRNVQLEADRPANGKSESVVPHMPWQVLLLGRGTADDRAWVFILLCRQMGIDAVMLAFDPPDAVVPSSAAGGAVPPPADVQGRLQQAPPDTPRTWLPAVLVGGQLYMFDTRLGLAFPGPGGSGVATLAQVADDPRLLRQLDLIDGQRYPVEADDLARLAGLVEASPAYLSHRMRLMESHLPAAQEMVMATRPSSLIAALGDTPQLQDRRLWLLPYERLDANRRLDRRGVTAMLAEIQPFEQPTPTLRRGRVAHLAGRFSGQASANYYYQRARLPEEDMRKLAHDPTRQQLLRAMKEDASYWLGLVAYERGNYAAAAQLFDELVLQGDGRRRKWAGGARYNRGRACEALGQIDRAIAIYRSDDSAQQHGNLLRAQWLAAGKVLDAGLRGAERSPEPSMPKH